MTVLTPYTAKMLAEFSNGLFTKKVKIQVSHFRGGQQMAAEFKNELLKAQSGRFSFNFGIDQSVASRSPKKEPTKPPGVIVRGVETKEITKKPLDRSPGEGERKPQKKRLKIDRGGCLAFIALLSFILILSLAVFALLNPVFFQNLIRLWF